MRKAVVTSAETLEKMGWKEIRENERFGVKWHRK
jgi:hypothetical protein